MIVQLKADNKNIVFLDGSEEINANDDFVQSLIVLLETPLNANERLSVVFFNEESVTYELDMLVRNRQNDSCIVDIPQALINSGGDWNLKLLRHRQAYTGEKTTASNEYPFTVGAGVKAINGENVTTAELQTAYNEIMQTRDEAQSLANTAGAAAASAQSAAETARQSSLGASSAANYAETQATQATTAASDAQNAAEIATNAVSGIEGLPAQIEAINTVLEQSGLVSKYKATIEDTYTERVTADGANVLDGSKAKLEKVVGSTVACKNLIPYPYVVLEGAYSGLTYKANDDGSFLLKGKSTNAQPIILATIELSSNTYYFKNGRNGYGAYAFIKRANGTMISSDQSFVVEEKETVTFGVYTGYKIEVDYIVYPMLSTENIAWQPYFTGLKSASFAGIESTNPDGTGISTLDFPKTETPLGVTIDFETKKITDYGVDLVLTGTENWIMRGQTYNDVSQFYSLLLDNMNYNFGEGVCTDFDKLSALINKVGFAVGSMNAALYLSVDKTQFTSVDDLKAWLAQRYADGNPVKIRYVSSTLQSETDFTPEQSASGNEYTAYKGGTEKVLDNDGKDYGADNTLSQNYIIVTGVK